MAAIDCVGIYGDRTSAPEWVTRMMLDALELKPEHKLLEIGTGTMRQTMVFAESGCEIHSIELEPWIDAVNNDGYTNIYLHIGDGRHGIQVEAPFDAVVATCGLEEVPKEWIEQLIEGGRLIAPVGDSRVQRLCLFRKESGELRPDRVLAYVRFQMMKDRPKPGKVKYGNHEA